MAAISVGKGRFVTGVGDIVITPRDGGRGRRAVVLGHGQLQVAADWVDPAKPGMLAVAMAIVNAGLVCVGMDLTALWGNDSTVPGVTHGSTDNMETMRATLGTYGAATDKLLLVGASMGATSHYNYCRTYPTKVAVLAGIIPTSDMNDLRDNNRAGTGQANINTAWNLTVGSTSATVALPARADPTTNASTIATSAAIPAKCRMYYSTADAVVIPATVTTLATALGVTPTVIDTTSGHTDTTVGLTPMADLLPLLLSAA